MSGYTFHGGEKHGIKAWDRGVFIDGKAMSQLHNLAKLPFIFKHVAAMPDAHWGMGSTVGSVIPTKGAIIPASVGVDIGCGLMAQQLSLSAEDLPDSLRDIRLGIEDAVPVGFSIHDQRRSGSLPKTDTVALDYLEDRHPKLFKGRKLGPHELVSRQLGTLGGGNHFIEVCLDEDDRVWVMLHSGSRGIGNQIGQYFIRIAKREMERFFIHLPDKDLAYLVEGTEYFNDYRYAVGWAQDYAKLNRERMMRLVLRVLAEKLPEFSLGDTAVNCHHNYVEKENHFGRNVWLTRKGAVRAREGDLGIIPGSMGARSYIVRGKGNPDSFMSCSHGAGRAMSRGEAKQKISLEDHIAATEGVECRKDRGVLDESPGAYKDIDSVMAAQEDLVDVVHELRQVVCVKG